MYLLTEACLGGDLFSYLENFGPLNLDVSRFVVACVVEALEYLHRDLHVIHRDVKTENLLIGKHGKYIIMSTKGCTNSTKVGATNGVADKGPPGPCPPPPSLNFQIFKKMR